MPCCQPRPSGIWMGELRFAGNVGQWYYQWPLRSQVAARPGPGLSQTRFVTTKQWRVEMDVADAHEYPAEHLRRCHDPQIPVRLLAGDHLGGDACGDRFDCAGIKASL